ncbi:hypothetical protein ES708_27019 [subsurface metagenome]
MNKDLKKEGFKLFKKIFGNDLSFEELEEILEENQNKELIIFLFKNLINFFGLSIKLGQKIDQNVCLEMPPKKFFKTLKKTIIQVFQNNPDLVKQFEKVGNNLAQMFQSLDFHKEFFSISTGNEFEDLIKKRFLEELVKAEQISKKAVVKSFKLALEYVERKLSPDKLFRLSNYNKLGIKPENLKTDTTLNLIVSFLEIISTKKQELFKLSDDEILDYMNELVSRLGRAIEPYLKVIIVSIYNLQKISKGRRFDNFKKGFGYYLSPSRSLQIQHSNQEDYIDYRNAIKHDLGFDVFPDRELDDITIKFYLERETRGRVYWKKTVEMGLKEFEMLFRDFRKFQDSFFSFYEVYIKSIDKNYQLKYCSIKAFFN